MSPAGKTSIVGQGFCESHADAGPGRGREANQERVPAFLSGERSGEYRR
jgi:hypothetical protein